MTQRIYVMYAGYVVEAAVTRDLFARPRHPYTVGLLHSIPRLDAQPGEPLIPIEGLRRICANAPVGCQFAPRCAWRQDRCWQEMPPLDLVDPNRDFVATGPQATHRAACWNQPTPEEAVAARPLRSGSSRRRLPRRRAHERDERDERPDDSARLGHPRPDGRALPSARPLVEITDLPCTSPSRRAS